jgi:hypothetical protein
MSDVSKATPRFVAVVVLMPLVLVGGYITMTRAQSCADVRREAERPVNVDTLVQDIDAMAAARAQAGLGDDGHLMLRPTPAPTTVGTSDTTP